MDRYKEKMPSYSQKQGLPRFKPLIKNDLPSPVTYNPVDKTSSTVERSPTASFPKGRVKNYLA